MIKENIKEMISDELRALRAKYNYNLKEASAKSGVNKDTICKYENNPKTMQIDILDKLLLAYNTTFLTFFTNIYNRLQ